MSQEHPSVAASSASGVNVIPVDFGGGEAVKVGRGASGGGGHRKKSRMRGQQAQNMDPDYRDYYRDRQRGEFLTRGAAISSQPVGAGASAADYVSGGGGGPLAAVVPPPQVVGRGAGSGEALYGLSSHPQHEAMEREPRRYVTGSELIRVGRPGAALQQQQQAKEARAGAARNVPTILRKKMDICVYLMAPVGLKMEIEEGATVTAAEVVAAMAEDERLGLPSATSAAAAPSSSSRPSSVPSTAEVFALWMTSPLLEVQLRPHHKPYFIRREWNHFLQRFSSAPLERKAADEPILSLQRNVFFHRRDEARVRDAKVLELLYEEAKYNVLTGRYPCEISDYVMLGGIQARLELKAYDAAVHTPAYFRTIMYRFLPEHATLSSHWSGSWVPWRSGAKNTPEHRLIEQFKAIPTNASPKRLVRKYLEFCWSLPYYGSAFFHGQIETPARSLTSLLINHDTEVLVAINASGFYVIDPANVVVLLGLKLEELSWDYAKPSQENNEDCLPCLFVQFCVIEGGRRVSKILQIFSRQAIQMDALIATFVDEYKQRVMGQQMAAAAAAAHAAAQQTAAAAAASGGFNPDVVEHADAAAANIYDSSNETDDCLVPLTTVSRRGIPESCLSNKLNKLTLATFDDEGHCIGHMGSWSFSN